MHSADNREIAGSNPAHSTTFETNMFTIQVKYKTGDSFNSYEKENRIGLCWKSIELARKALAVLEEHYNYYKDIESGSYYARKEIDKLRKKAMNTDWYKQAVAQSTDDWYKRPDMWYINCAVQMDNGDFRNIPVNMWCGYFERLLEASIVLEETSDLDHKTFH